MSVKMIIMDLDGTLLNSKKQITEKTEKKLIEMQEKGVILVLASGRIKSRMYWYADQLQMNNFTSYLIEANGSCIYDYKNQTRKVLRSLEKKEAQEIIQFIEDKHPDKQLAIIAQDHVFVRSKDVEKGEFIDYNMRQMFKERVITPFDTLDEIHELMFKVNVYGPTEWIEEMKPVMKETFNGRYWSGRTAPFCMENVPVEVSKGRAVRMLMEQYNLSKEEVLIFGDGDNDISMMQEATGVCMANAMDSVKDKFNLQTLSCDEDGIAYFLENLEKIKE